jgi:hypothetical protein
VDAGTAKGEGEGEGREGEGEGREGREVHPRGCDHVSARTLGCVRADAGVLVQVTSNRTLQCVQVTDAPRPSSDRPSVCLSENVRVTTMLRAGPLFFTIFEFFFHFYFWYYDDGPGILGEWVYSTSIF